MKAVVEDVMMMVMGVRWRCKCWCDNNNDDDDDGNGSSCCDDDNDSGGGVAMTLKSVVAVMTTI